MAYCGPHEGRHTGLLVAQKLDDIIKSLNLGECHIGITTDNASNMKVAWRESTTIDHGRGCFAHTIHLIVNNGLSKVDKIANSLNVFKKLAKAFNQLSLYIQRIKKECDDLNKSGTTPVHYNKIIQSVDTRWNSTLMMIRSIVQLRPALEAIRIASARSTAQGLIDLMPDTEDFQLLESIIPILTKFEEVSIFMSGEKYPTICWIIQKVYFLQNLLSSTIAKKSGVEDDSLR
jgi:hypothetical protein